MSMKRIWIVLLGLFLSTAIHAEDLRVGIVSYSKLLAPRDEQFRKGIERDFSSREKKLNAKGKEIEQLEEKLGRDAEILSASERAKLEKDILSKRREYKTDAADLGEDINLKRNEEQSRAMKEINDAVDLVAKEENLNLVLTAESVPHFDASLDITKKVESKLGADYGSGKSSKSKLKEPE